MVVRHSQQITAIQYKNIKQKFKNEIK